jgi:hypothetical protein
MEFIKKNITLIVGISIPILMILFVAGIIYLPGLFIQPKFNFLYVSGDSYYYPKYQYSVQNGKLVRSEIQRPENQIYIPPREVKLYIYDVAKNESKEISFEEAQKLNLDPSPISPDGFEIVYGSHSEGSFFFPFFFWSERDYSTLYLKGHNVSKKLNPQLSGSYYNYYDNFRFIGWIK